MRASWLLSTTAALTLLWIAAGLIIMGIATTNNHDVLQEDLEVPGSAVQSTLQVWSLQCVPCVQRTVLAKTCGHFTLPALSNHSADCVHSEGRVWCRKGDVHSVN